MLIINRLKVLIKATNREYVFDEKFTKGLNFIASDKNTRGKSSVLIAIYYAMGLEEIIGGVNEKVLTSAYKTIIEDGDSSWPVLESCIYLEISNGYEDITIVRNAKSETKNSKLVTVYMSNMDNIFNEDTILDEYYVHMPNAAKNDKGFHHFLEKFLHMDLPLVPSNDGVDRKLYLQLVFSAMFIEQKNGWAGIYSGMPYLSIKDAKKRVTEFVLGLSTFENERNRNALANKERYLKDQWKTLYGEMTALQKSNQCIVKNIPINPEILAESFVDNISIVRSVGDNITIDKWIEELHEEHDLLITIKPRIVDNYDELRNELVEIENDLSVYQNEELELQHSIVIEKRKISELRQNLDIINLDILNNKDAQRLQELGGQLQCKSFEGVCPICNQKIQDSLLAIHHQNNMMTIEQTINHLNAQKEMLEFALEYHKNRKNELESVLQDTRAKINSLFMLAKTIRRDLYSVDEDLSETIIYKRIAIEHHITELEEFKNCIYDIAKKFISLSEKWKSLLEDKAKLPKAGFSEDDEKRILGLKKDFISNLRSFNYTSISNIDGIEISKDNYMPVIDKFDMKFDSSASDNIRAIWSYTLALLQTSEKNNGNHPGVIIFDEPTQHSIGADDTKAFFDKIISLGGEHQIIVGITVNNEEIKKAIEDTNDKDYNYIHIGDKAFT